MQTENKTGIYCIENITTNKKYIGQSIDVNDRWRRHKSELIHKTHCNDYLQNAWNKYGEDDFKFYVLEYCKNIELNERENYYISLYDTLDHNYGYNLKSGGQNGGSTVSDYVRKKMSKSVKQSYLNNVNLKEKRKKDALNQWSNPEIKSKIIGINNGMYGKHHTEESRQKISTSRKGIPSPRKNTTPVFCIELNQKFNDATTAAKELSLDSSGILKVCQGKRKTCGGYHFNFLKINIGK